jgi:hypothetical protein
VQFGGACQTNLSPSFSLGVGSKKPAAGDSSQFIHSQEEAFVPNLLSHGKVAISPGCLDLTTPV